MKHGYGKNHILKQIKRFRFAWAIADFIIKGERLERPEDMNEKYYEIIKGSWKTNPKERMKIEEIERDLETLV